VYHAFYVIFYLRNNNDYNNNLPKSMSSIVALAPSTMIVLGDGPLSTLCR